MTGRGLDALQRRTDIYLSGLAERLPAVPVDAAALVRDRLIDPFGKRWIRLGDARGVGNTFDAVGVPAPHLVGGCWAAATPGPSA